MLASCEVPKKGSGVKELLTPFGSVRQSSRLNTQKWAITCYLDGPQSLDCITVCAICTRASFLEISCDCLNRFQAASETCNRLSVLLQFAIRKIAQVERRSRGTEGGPIKLLPHFLLSVIRCDKEIWRCSAIDLTTVSRDEPRYATPNVSALISKITC